VPAGRGRLLILGGSAGNGNAADIGVVEFQ
jgi:hypothetical protein